MPLFVVMPNASSSAGSRLPLRPSIYARMTQMSRQPRRPYKNGPANPPGHSLCDFETASHLDGHQMSRSVETCRRAGFQARSSRACNPYLEKVCSKLRVRTRIEAVAVAVRAGVIEPD
jgi:hypothetical protein